MAAELEAALADACRASRCSSRGRPTRVFVGSPTGVAGALRARGWRFYDFIGAGGSRLMCAWDTTPEDVERLAGDVAALVRAR